MMLVILFPCACGRVNCTTGVTQGWRRGRWADGCRQILVSCKMLVRIEFASETVPYGLLSPHFPFMYLFQWVNRAACLNLTWYGIQYFIFWPCCPEIRHSWTACRSPYMPNRCMDKQDFAHRSFIFAYVEIILQLLERGSYLVCIVMEDLNTAGVINWVYLWSWSTCRHQAVQAERCRGLTPTSLH